jgi:hypothetical protein
MKLLANYGYLPRNGHVNLPQTVEASLRGFNMGSILPPFLQQWRYIVEADISLNREDYYTGCGDYHQLSSRIIK